MSFQLFCQDNSLEHDRQMSDLTKEIESRGALIVANRKEYEIELENLRNKIDEHEQTIDYLNDVIRNAETEAETVAMASADQLRAVKV